MLELFQETPSFTEVNYLEIIMRPLVIQFPFLFQWATTKGRQDGI